MSGSGSSIFTYADGYQSNLQDIFDLLVLQPRKFHARLTWAVLPNLQLLRARESSERLAYMKLPDDRAFVTFPTRHDSMLVYGAVSLGFGNIMFHSRGEKRHQRTLGACEWASIAVEHETLLTLGRTLADTDLVAPSIGQLVRPRQADNRRLLRLHAQVGRIAEKSLERLASREVARGLEQDLIGALIACLVKGEVQTERSALPKKAGSLSPLEALLAASPYRLLRTREISDHLAMSEATLKTRCLRELGMGPGRYQRLRRLKFVRAELLRNRTVRKHDIEAIIARYGFHDIHRFVTEYWQYYGEMPLIPSVDSCEKS